ncbi:D-2-hydroxyacid dehydrogenase [Candidatus Aciduliprofundum boonei]|uniref:Phosphoglycerate dehydrogenase n=1 Tax=Aciduliprofundum boonei (strain DSM 19572 / T469) TaxID=439481 RepID=D3TAU9_ACIB4|nr:D-2-hydroxyacid dehydrogenase [Candidatus Aciduliprofundum boonei]ADD09228.1 Phosphoglycerate dehydrogenase [Aciduliprofundum boonei T469]HII55808.1 3-phosphoglycerate dehydrogenase [Candidatus Aciduliprofundum boonei]
MKVGICDPIAKEGVELLKKEGFEVVDLTGLPKDELSNHVRDLDAIIVRSATKVRKEMIDAAEKLKAIGRAGVGLDNIDVEYAKSKGIKVINTPGATSISVAELTIGLILAVMRKIAYADREMRNGAWPKKKCKGIEMYGKTLGIIGIGRIGREVAKRATAFGMKVIYYDVYRPDESTEKELAIEFRELDALVSEADVITLHLPLTPETKHLINKERIEMMKDGAIIINAARGGIVDENALYEALKSGKLYGAALDVYENEPLKESKLFELDNIVLTPHIGAQAKEGQTRAGIEVAKKIAEALKS